jgi:hypothetical protein
MDKIEGIPAMTNPAGRRHGDPIEYDAAFMEC